MSCTGTDVCSDNNEYFLRDDAILLKNEFDNDRTVEMKGPQSVGLMGRMTGTEMMNKIRCVLVLLLHLEKVVDGV